MDSSLQAIEQAKASALDMAIRFGPKLIVALAILAIGYVVARWAGRLVGRVLARFWVEAPMLALINRVVQLLVIALFTILALQNLGVELLPLIAGLGVAGAGVALAMQGLLGNIVAGLTIIFTRPFHIGDYISIVGEEGIVLEISLFNTTLGHTDRSRVVIPNRKIVGEILHNHGQVRQLQLNVNVSYESDIDSALAAVREVLAESGHVLKDPAPVIGIVRLVDSGATLWIRPWVAVPDYEAALVDINKRVLEVFSAKGIVIPPLLRELRIVGDSSQGEPGGMRPLR